MSNTQTIYVNKHNNILIIGKAATNYSEKEIGYWKNYDDVLESFGQSNLTDAFKTAQDMGVEDIFLMNVRRKNDYLDIIEPLRQNDFAYIVFTDLFISDFYRDTLDLNVEHNYFAYIMGMLGPDHNSTLIATDKHASLFETIDDFIEYMNSASQNFIQCCSGQANKENMLIVGNNLKNSQYANVVLAAAICTSPINEYPTANFGQAVFNIDAYDKPGCWAYFRNHEIRETTVENLQDCKDSGLEKVFTVSRTKKYVDRHLDFSDFKGKLYNSYIKLRVMDRLEKYMGALVGKVIRSYEIGNIAVYKDNPGTVKLVCYLTIVPNNCLEVIHIDKEVII